VEPNDPHRLHHLVMDLIRVAGLLQPDHAMPAAPVTMSQAFALHELDIDGALSQQDLADRLSLEKSTVSRLVAELERKEYVVRERDPANRRFNRIRLTSAGRAAHARVRTAMHDHFVEAVSTLDAAHREALLNSLPALIAAMRGDQREAAPAEHAARQREPGA
jgi:DNA-binding MarR family transcriptional regulator